MIASTCSEARVRGSTTGQRPPELVLSSLYSAQGQYYMDMHTPHDPLYKWKFVELLAVECIQDRCQYCHELPPHAGLQWGAE